MVKQPVVSEAQRVRISASKTLLNRIRLTRDMTWTPMPWGT